ncbi:YheC/YheD family protein [Natranaerobius trueperi]|nr:YheC/YheD family protein [Natranaerobius trueperi]
MSKKKPLIGVFKNKLKPSHRLKSTPELNVDLVIFSPKSIDWEQKNVKGLLLIHGYYEERVVSFPDAVFMRKLTTFNTWAYKLEEVIGENKVFNNVTRFDKWKIYRILKKGDTNCHLPNTHKFKSKQLIDLLHRYKKIILKSRKGCLGRQVYKVEKDLNDKFYFYEHLNSPALTTHDEKILLDKIETITSGKARYIVQEYIEFDRVDNNIYDIRMFVQKDGTGNWGVTGGFCRLSGLTFYKTNFSSKLITIDEMIKENNCLTQSKHSYIKEISLQIAKDLENGYNHLGDICIDFGLSQDGYVWIIEVNSKAGKNIVRRLGDDRFTRNVYLRPIEYARYLALKSNCNDNKRGGGRNLYEY